MLSCPTREFKVFVSLKFLVSLMQTCSWGFCVPSCFKPTTNGENILIYALICDLFFFCFFFLTSTFGGQKPKYQLLFLCNKTKISSLDKSIYAKCDWKKCDLSDSNKVEMSMRDARTIRLNLFVKKEPARAA